MLNTSHNLSKTHPNGDAGTTVTGDASPARVLGESRASVLRSLQGGPKSVTEIIRATGLTQSNVSNHLSRLREMDIVAARREGKRVFYALVDPDLVRVLLSQPARTGTAPEEQEDTLQNMVPTMETAFLEGRPESVRELVHHALALGIPWQDLYLRVFEPVMKRIGDLWEAGAISVSEEHAASQMVERMMAYVASLRIPEAKEGARCVVACAEGEHHQIGARMIADFLASGHRHVVYLGADAPNEDLMRFVDRYRPEIVAVSATSEERLPRLRDLVRELQDMRKNAYIPRILLGGRLFELRPELYDELGVAPPPDSLIHGNAPRDTDHAHKQSKGSVPDAA